MTKEKVKEKLLRAIVIVEYTNGEVDHVEYWFDKLIFHGAHERSLRGIDDAELTLEQLLEVVEWLPYSSPLHSMLVRYIDLNA
jgi:hypothetical protein